MSTSVIAGIHVDVYGLDDQIRQSKRPLVVLFVLHGRYGSATEPKTVSWCNRLLESARSSAPSASKDLIIVAFDQRNHGRRSADPKRNFGWHESWQGESYHNETHAVDCFSMQCAYCFSHCRLIAETERHPRRHQPRRQLVD